MSDIIQIEGQFYIRANASIADAGSRVLKHGGRFCFNVWDKISENEFADVVTQALAEMFPQDPPRFMARTPHGYCDMELVREQLRAAGFFRQYADRFLESRGKRILQRFADEEERHCESSEAVRVL